VPSRYLPGSDAFLTFEVLIPSATTRWRSAGPPRYDAPSMRAPFALVSTLALCSACIVEAPGAPKQGPAAQGLPQHAHLAAGGQAPLQLKVGANFEDKLELIGVTVQPGQLLPGEQGRVTAYFKVLAPVGEDYMVFIHVEDPEGHMERLNVDHAPGGGVRPTSQWTVGETIQDEFTVYVPPNSQVRALNIWGGFWQPRTDARLKLKNVDQIRNDGNNRILFASVPVVQ
jgi:hypothetical protein